MIVDIKLKKEKASLPSVKCSRYTKEPDYTDGKLTIKLLFHDFTGNKSSF